MTSSTYHDPLQPHAHDPNPEPPSADPAFVLHRPDHVAHTITIRALDELPHTILHNCYIVSTGHGTSGPFTFSGVTLRDLLAHYLPPDVAWQQVEVIGGDGFGTRVWATELEQETTRPILLATHRNGVPLTRAQGLVRLIVPHETDDALRQVKWIRQLNVLATGP